MDEKCAKVFRELAKRTRMSINDLMCEISAAIEDMMENGIDERANRIVFMADSDLKNSMVHLRFAPLFVGSSSKMPSEIQEQLKRDEAEEIGKEDKSVLEVDLTKPKKKESKK